MFLRIRRILRLTFVICLACTWPCGQSGRAMSLLQKNEEVLTPLTEAFSQTFYRHKRQGREKQKERARVIVKPNSVKFRSNNYDTDKSMIEVSW
jgi:hypothetical protein